MPTINLGKVRFTWRGAYDNLTAYETNDVINYNGSSYVAVGSVAAESAITPPNDISWEVFSQGVNDVATTIGDLVFYNGTSLQRLGVGEVGEVLKVDANGEPAWTANTVRKGTRVESLPDQRYSFGGYNRGMVRMQDGTLRSWGNGSAYGLGQGQTQTDRTYPGYVAFPPNTANIASGKMYSDYNTTTGAIDEDGNFWAWGLNNYGELGTGDAFDRYVPYNVSANVANSLNGRTALHAYTATDNEGYQSWHVLTSDGTVHSAGYNNYGQLGQGDTTTRNLFNKTPVLTGITQLAIGSGRFKHVLALKVDGETNYVYSWGYNSQGQLGSGNNTQANIPMQIQYFNTNSIKIVELLTSQYASYCLADNGDLYSFGYNNQGQLGIGNTTNQNVPTLAATDVAEFWAGRDTSNSIWIKKTDGSIHASGNNRYGMLSVDGSATNRQAFGPCVYEDGSFVNSGVIKVIVNDCNAHILKTDGTVWSVGYAATGGLGQGDNVNKFYFNQVPIHRRSVKDISNIGADTTSAGLLLLLDDGQLLMYGGGDQGQSSDDDNEDNFVPNPIIF